MPARSRSRTALQTKPRTPVIWLHGLECTCCSESFIRSAHPLAKDVILSMISLDYDDTLMAAAGHQAERALEETIEKYKGNYILAVEGNPPLADDGIYCIPGGQPFVEKLRHVAKDAKAIISWGSCASWGCVQAAKPNPTRATPIHKVITDKPIVKVPGCPPIAEVMTGVVTYILTFDRLPDLDAQGRPKMFYSQRVHDKCYRRAALRRRPVRRELRRRGRARGLLPLQGGLQGPDDLQRVLDDALERGHVVPDPVGARLHRLLGGRRSGTRARFYDHLTTMQAPGIERRRGHRRPASACAALIVTGAAVAAHAAVSAIKQARSKSRERQGQRGGEVDHGHHQTQGFTLDNSGKRIVVDPITRIEGHLRIEVNVDKDNVIRNAVSTGTMWRGLEVILKGRDPRDAWAFVERICGVCTGVHALASVRVGRGRDRRSRSRRTRTSSAT